MIQSRGIRYAKRILYGEMKNVYTLLSENKSMENLGVDSRLMLEPILQNSL
jgi:hypothetical protein